MSNDFMPTHLKEMRNFIAISSQDVKHEILNQYVEQEISPAVKQARLVVESLEEIGLDKLALLFEDRSHAEIILENCSVFRKKFADNDFRTTELIAEAFTKIFEKVEKSRFELIGLTEGHINVLKGNVQILAESYTPQIITENNNLLVDEFLEKLLNLTIKWELHREIDYTPEDFREGVEVGLLRAGEELKELYNEYKSKFNKRAGDI